jgi:hypothetical protein
MTDLKALAARCVDLSEDVVELNAEIAAAVHYVPHAIGGVWQHELRANSPEKGRVECCTSLGTGGPHYKAANYLTSIDAALSLARNGDEADAVMFRARKNIGEDFNLHISLWERSGLPYAPTLARYICAAALLMRSE